MKLEFTTTITNGTPSQSVQNVFNKFEGESVELTIQKARKRRSNQQNRYWWGVVIKIVKNALIEVGYYWTDAIVSEFLKARIAEEDPAAITEEVVFLLTGEITTRVKSTKELTKSEFADLVTLAQKWSVENLGVYIPDPNEQTQLNY